MSRHPVPDRGAFRDRHGRRVWDAVDAAARETNAAARVRRSRVVLIPRRWRQVGDDVCASLVTMLRIALK
jgi:hypothetical protein